ncbi:Adaptor-related protein complex 1 beta 1 subunit [Hyaloraphidium curvatum]|nr:Adaptor-related protein complex 1 beta 1 subunit [Hyaloraphidium curvatum]
MQTAIQRLAAQMQRSKIFVSSVPRKGENFELKSELNSEYRDRRKDAVKRVIANMTVGKDVSSLFADVVKNMQTDDIELKKLVYLYLINYAKSQPELVILAVNTFVKDTDDNNPLIRALAIRTMGCLRVEKIIDYLCEPLRKGLRDENPYVRKTAALCVAKLYDLTPQLAIDNGFVATLQDLLSDPNPMVIANAVAALTEINELTPDADVFIVNTVVLTKLLTALNDCTEWGQICILNTLAEYVPVDSKEAENVVEKVMPRLQHANASVVLSAVRVLMVYFKYVHSDEVVKQMSRKLTPPLVTLLSSEPEMQYVALRNINLILQRRPEVLTQDMRVFFCKYNDPQYVKLEKLDIMVKLTSEKNVEQVLSELKEYANEVDVDFVRRSIAAIGRCAIKIPSAAERAVEVLLELIRTKVNYVVQESVVALKDIFRKYPHSYETVIPALCENMDALDEPQSKAAMIWMIGEYAELVENAQGLLNGFLHNFREESPQVQLQLLTAVVKLFLKKPSQTQDTVQSVLQTASQVLENPDLRDRSYIYWRLLSTNPQAAKAVVLSEKPPIESESAPLGDGLLGDLIASIGSVASVYHKPPALMGGGTGGSIRGVAGGMSHGGDDLMGSASKDENLLDLDGDEPLSSMSQGPAPPSPGKPQKAGIDDLLDILGDGGSSAYGSSSGPAAFAASPPQPSRALLLAAAIGKGLEISGLLRPSPLAFELTFSNRGPVPLSDFAIQFNKNTYGLTPAAPLRVASPLAPGQSYTATLPMARTGPVQQMNPPNLLQIAVKDNAGVFYFDYQVPF